jgi:broad specificity phosphatase PhoE
VGAVTRYLYLARHGEAGADESTLTDRGREQARLLGRRLREVPLDAIHHGPLPRAVQTAQLVAGELDNVPVSVADEAGDYIPYQPDRAELPTGAADHYLDFLAAFPADERRPDLAASAVRRFTGPTTEPRYELLVTHNFLIGWLVRHALDAPQWRWLGLNHANAGLTVIRYAPARPPALLVHNDLRHLGADLRWTGFPAELAV